MWTVIGNFGDAAMTLPLALCCAVWIATSRRRLAWIWCLSFACGMAAVGITKILYAGCGIQIRSIDFRVISGHTMLATAIWTLILALLGPRRRGRWTLGAAVGGIAGTLIAIARVYEEAHTISEVIAGWAVGALVALVFLRQAESADFAPRHRLIAATAMLLIIALSYGRHLPIQQAIETYSPWLCKSR